MHELTIDREAGERIAARFARVLAKPSGELVPFRIGDVVVGRLSRTRVESLRRWPHVFAWCEGELAVELAPALASEADRSAALAEVATALAREGALSAWRNERYALAERFGAQPLARLERAAARYFGIMTYAAHLNAVVRENGSVMMWLARRSFDKPLDPGLLDNLVGGGIAADAEVAGTLVKEAWEEAAIPAALARTATLRGWVDIERDAREGLQRERVFVHDLELPPDFAPRSNDGECIEFLKVTLADAAALAAGDDMTVDASLAAVHYLLRNARVDDGEVAATLRRYCGL